MKLSKLIDKDLLSIDSEKGKLTLFGLAIPLFIETLGTHFINIITTMMSANFMDGFFVSPTGIVGNILGYAANVATIISTGASILLSIYLGKRRQEDCKSIFGFFTHHYIIFMRCDIRKATIGVYGLQRA